MQTTIDCVYYTVSRIKATPSFKMICLQNHTALVFCFNPLARNPCVKSFLLRDSRLNDAFLDLYNALTIQHGCGIAAFGAYAVELLCHYSISEDIEVVAAGSRETILEHLDGIEATSLFQIFATNFAWRITLLYQNDIFVHLYPLKVEGDAGIFSRILET
jgi:hypothetical protein